VEEEFHNGREFQTQTKTKDHSHKIFWGVKMVAGECFFKEG